ncbi:hypothetical protein [Shimia sp.]|uniref:hypothetical protein n=1 Tax=Shimia sp. TaxID=1954381 RepID=UPI003298527B
MQKVLPINERFVMLALGLLLPLALASKVHAEAGVPDVQALVSQPAELGSHTFN